MLQRALPRFAYFVVSILLIVVATSFALRIAITTNFDTHPDEISHADGFCFFESHWWPPPLNADGLRYNPYGLSRVYDEEIVYVVYGKLAANLRPIIEPWFMPRSVPKFDAQFQLFLPRLSTVDACYPSYYTYRLLNVLLLVITLSILFWLGRRLRWARSLALLMLAIPQVIYLYAYANSDAWALSISSFFLLTALIYHDRERLGWREAVWLGFLTGMVLLTKRPFWLTIPLAYLILMERWFQLWRRERGILRPLLFSWLPLVIVVTFLVILPLKIIYPLSQGDYAARSLEMREMRASSNLRPSSHGYGYLMASDGIPFSAIWADPRWRRLSAQSFYALFGYMSRPVPATVYASAALLSLSATLFTLVDYLRRPGAYSNVARILLFTAPFLIVLNIFSSMYVSWVFDYQPQGRYLFPTLFSLASWVGGAVDDETRWLRVVRVLLWLLLLSLSFYSLTLLLLIGPAL